MPQMDVASDIVFDEQFESIAKYIEELKLKAEGEISMKNLRNARRRQRKLDELIAKSPITVETRKIIRARASGLYASFPKISKRKIKSKPKKEKEVTE
jgi:hypothetical protein